MITTRPNNRDALSLWPRCSGSSIVKRNKRPIEDLNLSGR